MRGGVPRRVVAGELGAWRVARDWRQAEMLDRGMMLIIGRNWGNEGAGMVS